MASGDLDAGQAQLWDAAAKVRQRLMIDHLRPIWNKVLDLAGAGPNVRLLDAGCGSGESSAISVERGAETTGIDVSPNMIELAQKRCPAARFEVADVQALPFEDESFDASIMIHCVHFADDPLKAIGELRRVCRTGGSVTIVSGGEPHECGTATMARTLIGLVPEEQRTGPQFIDPYRLADVGVIEGLAEKAGLRVVETGKVDCPNEWESMDVAILAGQSMGLYHASSAIVGAEKVDSALRDVFSKHLQSDDRVVQPNRYRFVHCTRD